MTSRVLILFCAVTVFLFLSIRCTPDDAQQIELNWDKNSVAVLSSSYVIDSIYLEKSGVVYYSVGLKDKQHGEQVISFTNKKDGYIIYADSLGVLQCPDKFLNFGVIIRKKNSQVRVTRDVATGIAHNENIQILVGRQYRPCLKGLEIFSTDKKWR